MARQSLQSWILEALNDRDKPSGSCSVLILFHTIGSAKKEIDHVRFSSGKQWTPSELTERFEAKARSYAQDLPGRQLFEIEALYGTNTVPEAFHPFAIEGETVYMTGGSDSPDGKGLMQQMMRHNEALIALAFAALGENTRNLQSQNGQLATALENSRRAELDAVGIVKDLVLERANKQHEHRMKELEYARTSQERKKWLQFGPPLINSILGAEIFPQNTEDTALVEGIADKLTSEHIKRLAEILPPEYMGPLASRIQRYLEKKAAEEKEDTRLLGAASSDDAESDAAGDEVT
jgi:hypothetical protein